MSRFHIVVTVYDLTGNIVGSFTETIAGLSGVEREINQSLGLSLPADTVGRINVVSSVPGAIRSEVLRIKPIASDFTLVDNAISLPVR